MAQTLTYSEEQVSRADPYAEAMEALATVLHGRLVRPGDESFDHARRVHNGAIDRRPALIVQAADAHDVIVAVRFARTHDLSVVVRSGGHSPAGHGVSDGGIVIDLSSLNRIDIDPERRVARVEPGLTWNDVAEKAQPHGLAITSGDTGSVGVGGLTVGGGIGWMVRKYGLTIDHLLSADVVTADGELITTSDQQHPDLFWALRGGGGNFGIVTAFQFRLDPVGSVLGGAIIFDAHEAETILPAYAKYAAAAPDELTTMATIMHAPPLPFIPPHMHGKLVIVLMLCYTGDLEQGKNVVAPLRALGTPIADIVGPMPYPAMFAMTKEAERPGIHLDMRSMFLTELGGEALDNIVTYARSMPSPMSMMQIRILGGAMGRVEEDETAFAHRDKTVMVSLLNMWLDAAETQRQRAFVRRFWNDLRPYASGVYVNFLVEEGDDRVREAYKPTTYERLSEIKRRYDPTNVFKANQNIQPRETQSEVAA